MKYFIGLISLCFTCTGISQQSAIHFKAGKFSDIKALARVENKLIFIDVYTTWCGPCKKMSNEVFTAPEVGNYFNNHFINYKVDAERGEGIAIARKYLVGAFPTLLFIDSSGTEVYRIRGFRPYEPFLDEVKTILDPDHNAELAARYANDKAYRAQLEEERKKRMNFIQVLRKNPTLDSLHQKFSQGDRHPNLIGEYMLERNYLNVPEDSLLHLYEQASNQTPVVNHEMHYAAQALMLKNTQEEFYGFLIQYLDTIQLIKKRNKEIILTQLENLFLQDFQKAANNNEIKKAPQLFEAKKRLIALKDWDASSQQQAVHKTKLDFYEKTGQVQPYFQLLDTIWNSYEQVKMSADSIYKNNWALYYAEALLGMETLALGSPQLEQLLARAQYNNQLYAHPTTFAPIMLFQHRLNLRNESMVTMRKGMISGKKKKQDTEILFQLFTRIKKQ